MNRQEFFRRLEYLLRGIPEHERMDALAYYNDYFDDAGVENEQKVINELGSPEAVAQIILEDYHRGQSNNYGDYGSPEMEQEKVYEQGQTSYGEQSSQNRTEQQKGSSSSLRDKIKNMNTSTKVLVIIILVLTFPVWIGVVAGGFGAIVGLLGGLFGVVVGVGGSGVGILIAGLVCLVVGILRLLTSPVEGVVTIGIGALFTAISMLMVLLFVLVAFKWFPTLIRAIVKWIKGLWNRQEGGDEI
ncbi:MAG: hypothetical protein IJO60_09435 [Agathobacter sp.]|nr:hypothetical protein [Agathobacter sp.]